MATNVEFVEELYMKFNSGDIPAVTDRMADNIVWSEPAGMPYGGVYIGHQAVVEGVFMRLEEVGDDFHPSIEQIMGLGDTVVVIGHINFKRKGDGVGISVKTVWVHTVVDGRLLSVDTLFDSAEALSLN